MLTPMMNAKSEQLLPFLPKFQPELQIHVTHREDQALGKNWLSPPGLELTSRGYWKGP